MRDIHAAVSGTVGTEPDSRVTSEDKLVTSFRMASTPRYYDKQTKSWKDAATNWITVECWGPLGRNVLRSLYKGAPIVVSGRVSVREWTTANGEYRTRTVINADAVGFDFTYGIATFQKIKLSERPPVPGEREADEMADAAWPQVDDPDDAADRSGPLEPGVQPYEPEEFANLDEEVLAAR